MNQSLFFLVTENARQSREFSAINSTTRDLFLLFLVLRCKIMFRCIPVMLFKGLNRCSDNLFCREKQIISMKPVRIDIDLCFNACSFQMVDIIYRFLKERFDVSHKGVARRKSLVVSTAGWCSIA